MFSVGRNLITGHTAGIVRSRLGYFLSVLSVCFILSTLVRPSMSHPQFIPCVQVPGEALALNEVLAPKPIWVVAIAYLHMPAILLAANFTRLANWIFSLSCGPATYTELVVLLVSSPMQWMIVGYGIERLIRRRAEQALAADAPQR